MLESSPKKNIYLMWLKWHFKEVPLKILKVSKGFLVFNFNYFSVFSLLKTLFAPWRKYKESYGRGFDLKRFLETFIGNMISRTLGLIVRVFLIFVGLLTEIFIFAISVFIFLFWFLSPFISIYLLILGIQLI